MLASRSWIGAVLSAAPAVVAALLFATVVGNASTAGATGTGGQAVDYDSTLSPLPGNIPSYGAEAYAFNEIGNQVTLAPSGGRLADVTVTMSSWACESGGWTGPTPCTTTPGATFAVPITFDIYHPGTTPGTVGSLITSSTQTFNIPYRPSADPACTSGPTKWMDSNGTCYNGLADNITFDFSSKDIALPSTVVYGISYNTDNYGPEPIGGTTSPTDSLNVAFTTESSNVSAGADVNPGNIFVNSASATNSNLFCGSAVPDTFVEVPNGCVSGTPPTNDIPAVQFTSAPTTAPPTGYWQVASDGGVFSFGPQFYGSTGDMPLNAPVVGLASTPNGSGYWEVASDGGIFTFGNARFYGSMGGTHLNRSVVGMARTSTGDGYWLVAADGGVFNFGDAGFYGSMGGQHLSAPIVAIVGTPSGQGYWEVGADGAVYGFGNGRDLGSMAGAPLRSPIVGIAATPSGNGYWLVASDGGVFNFGDAGFYGSMGGQHLNKPVVGITGTVSGAGYTEVASDGGVFNFGDSVFTGSMGGRPLQQPVVGITTP